MLGKLHVEIALGIIPHHTSNFCDGIIGCDEQGLCLANTSAQQILDRGVTAHFLKHMGYVIRTGIQSFCNGL